MAIRPSDGGTGGGGGGQNAGTLKFDESSFEVLEESGVALVTVERSHGTDGVVSVDYDASGGTATAGDDYTPVSGTLSWFDGDGTDKTFVVPILDDEESEGDETIDLELFNATGGADIDGERGTSIVRILASDGGAGGGGAGPAGALKFDEMSFEVIEEALVVTITVERSMGESGVVTVEYGTTDGSATGGVDYAPASGVLTWGDGDGADKTFSVSILEDAEEEGDETIVLDLFNATDGAVVDGMEGSSMLTILASDGGDGGGGTGVPGTLKFGEASFEVQEGAGTAIITVERSGGDSGSVSVDYMTFDGTASDGFDYTGVTGTLTWSDGDDADQTILVLILEDEAVEGNENLALALLCPGRPFRHRGRLAGLQRRCRPWTAGDVIRQDRVVLVLRGR